MNTRHIVHGSDLRVSSARSPYYSIRDGDLLLCDADASIPCPVCRTGNLNVQREGLLPSLGLATIGCSECKAVFQGVLKDRYLLIPPAQRNKSPVVEEYKWKPLRLEEWKRISNGGKSDAKQRENDLAQWLENLRLGLVPITCINAPLTLLPQPNEEVLCALPGVSLREPRSVRVGSGIYGGPSVRVTKGVYLRLGGFGSTSRYHNEIRKIDVGVLSVTNRRVVFSGAHKTMNVEFSKILEMRPFDDGLALHRSTSQKTQYFSWGNDIRLEITMNGRTYREPLSGLILQYLIEGLARR